jgi:hypothetical protein
MFLIIMLFAFGVTSRCSHNHPVNGEQFFTYRHLIIQSLAQSIKQKGAAALKNCATCANGTAF